MLTPLLLAVAAQAAPSVPAATLDLVRLTGDRARTAAALLDLDVAERGDGWVDVIATAADAARLARLGVDATVRIVDLEAYYAARLAPMGYARGSGTASWLQPPFGMGSMGGYYTLAEVEAILDQMAAAYPALVAPRVSLGQSLEGREQWMVKISDNPGVDEAEPEVRIDALHHAREPQGMQTTLYFMSWLLENHGTDPLATYLVDERELYFVPCVNPDGFEYNRQTNPGGGGLWRKNRRDNGGGVFGVDLNRNYPYEWGPQWSGSSSSPSSATYRGTAPASEPEVQAMVAFMAARDFETALSVHTYSNLWLAPWGYDQIYTANRAEYDEVGALATEVNGYEFGAAWEILYLANGVTFDQDHGVHGTLAWTPEIGSSSDGFWPLQTRIVPLAEENLVAFQRTALAAGPWVRPTDVTLTDLGDGDGAFEPGERIGVTVGTRNSGRAAAAAVALGLSSTSAFATITDGAAAVGAVGPFADGAQQDPLELALSPAAPFGATVPFTVEVVADGLVQTLEGELSVGVVAQVAGWDFEAAGDEGWALGAPNTATTGTWERVDPVGTAAQPEDDHTPAGARCWVTGQGLPGGALGANDVDGGATTLVSPTIDLSGVPAPRISYWRWYSNDTGSAPGADVFEVELSNDDGATWVTAEVVGPNGPGTTGGWELATLDVAAILAPTDRMRVRFIASDLGPGSIVEAAIDDVEVRGAGSCWEPATYCGTSPNAWGAGALLDWTGTASLAANNLDVSVSGANPSGFGVFFRGDAPAQVPAGNGVLCVGGTLDRILVASTDPAGAALFAVDLGALSPTLAAGERAYFQYWYRDLGGAGWNYSDALLVTFCD